MSLSKRRWLVLIASCIINLCVGSLGAWSVFAAPMAEHLTVVTGNKITSLAMVFAVANSVGPVTMIAGGAINDHLGPRKVIILGGILFSLGMFASGYANSILMLLATYGLGVGLGVGLVYGCTVSNAVKFFPDKAGVVSGLTTAFYGISSVVVPPIANNLNQELGITSSFKILGIANACIILFSSFLVIRCPAGFKPNGWNPTIRQNYLTQRQKNWKQMISDPIFYCMLTLFCCGTFSGLMVISQVSSIAQNMIGMSVAAAAIAVSTLALFNTLGRILAGVMSDKIGNITTLRVFFSLSSFGATLLFFSNYGAFGVFYIGIAAIGLGHGSIMGIFPSFTALQFGTRHNGVNFGIMFIGFAASGYFGPTLITSIYSQYSQYRLAFLISIAFSLIGLLLTVIYNNTCKEPARS